MGCSTSKAVGTKDAPATPGGEITLAEKAEYGAIVAEHGPQSGCLLSSLTYQYM